MFEISRIEELRTLARELLVEQEAGLAQKPDSVFRRMLVDSAKDRFDELTAELVVEKEKRELELVELRLVGPQAHYGSLPMQTLGQLTSAFEEMLVQIGRYLKHGSRGFDSVQAIRSLLDVRLNRLASGSTRLFITAKTNPDLFGDSVAETCLSRTFELLTVEASGDLVEKAGSIGKGGVQSLARFLKTLSEAELSASMNWQTPLDTTLSWEGSSERIDQLRQSLESLIETEPIEIPFAGEILMESIRGQASFEVRDAQSGKIMKGIVPQRVAPSLLVLHVGEYCRGIVSQTTISNQATGQQKHTYELLSIEAADAPATSQLPIVFHA